MEKVTKAVLLKKSTWMQLNLLKLEYDMQSLDAVIQQLLLKNKGKNSKQ
jgi:hypothetical protein